jgi:hypothetical protein
MNDTTLEQADDQIGADDEDLSVTDLTAEEMADDRIAHLLLTAWTAILKEDQEAR